MGDEQQYQALLSDYFWGVNAVVVNEFAQEYLVFSLWDARQLRCSLDYAPCCHAIWMLIGRIHPMYAAGYI